jgi:DNA-binding NarL/FixJ family response regulator
MDTNIRVLVANRPRLWRELVLSTLSEQAGIRVVGEVENEQDVPAQVAQTKPDFLLIGLDQGQKCPALCDVLLRDFPGLRIIAVAPNTNVGVCYWASLEIHAAKMEASKQALLEAIRAKTAPGKGAVV